ncbi:MAG: cytochrome c biogenesis protein CcdA, partial [Bdellovibrionota bacterium]
YCLLPTDKIIEVPINIKKSKLLDRANPEGQEFWSTLKGMTSSLRPDQQVTWLTFLLTFFAGVLTSLTPCVFPMIPITLGVLKNTMDHGSRSRLLGRALVYLAGMSLTYSALGILAAATGDIFGSMLGQAWFLITICIFLFLMALSLFGIYEINMPAKLQTYAQTVDTHSKRGVFIAGLLSGFLAAPCV